MTLFRLQYQIRRQYEKTISFFCGRKMELYEDGVTNSLRQYETVCLEITRMKHNLETRKQRLLNGEVGEDLSEFELFIGTLMCAIWKSEQRKEYLSQYLREQLGDDFEEDFDS